MPSNIVVVGAGVSGLTTAWLLAKNGNHKVTVIAKHMPGDYHIEYASPWAGADYCPMAKPGTPAQVYERDTWPELERLARDLPECGIHFKDAAIYYRTKDINAPFGGWIGELVKPDAWYSKLLPNFRMMPKLELPKGIDGGTAFTSVCINTALYLPWLASQCLRHGVVLKREIVSHITEAAALHHSGTCADLVVNCTGLSSLRLGGVEDDTMFPARGQTVLVRNETDLAVATSGTDDGEDEVTYAIIRAAGGGCILGGCFQPGNWDSQPDPNLAVRIMRRAVEVCPTLVPKGKGIEALSIIRHNVGLRPMRKDGPRVEREIIIGPDGRRLPVVHNYGHGGGGYQMSFGTARVAEKLVNEALEAKAKL